MTQLTEDQKDDMVRENGFLQNQVEVLLDMNANYEMKKLHLQGKLEQLLDQIKHYPGLDEEPDLF
jgi:hypothetical protein